MLAYMRFSMTARRSLMTAICPSRSFCVAGQHGAARRGVGPLGLEGGQLRFDGGESRRLDERGASVLELRDGRVAVLDGEQVGQVVRHASSS